MVILEALTSFISYAILAAFAENALLNRSLDASSALKTSIHHPRSVVWYGLFLTLMTTVSALPVYIINLALQDFAYRIWVLPLAYVILITGTYFAAIEIIRNYLPKIYLLTIRSLPFATFNCALFGGLLIAGENSYKLSQTLGYAFGIGVGYTLATVMVVEGLRRLALCDVPKPFRGLPVSLIYLGILSLAVYGLTGRWLVY